MNREAAIRKAALLVSALDDDAAQRMLDELPGDLADAIRVAVANLDEAATAQRETIVVEFLDSQHLDYEDEIESYPREARRARSERPTMSNIETIAPAADNFQPLYPAMPAGQRVGSPFQALHCVDPDVLASLLEGEPPPIVGIVIANLPAHKAGDLLARLPADVQTDVIHRLARPQRASSEVLEEIDRYLTAQLAEQKIAPTADNRDDAGMATVSAILNSADEAARRQILTNLAARDRPLAGKLRPRTRPAATPQFTFEEVCRLEPASLIKVVQAAPRETVVLALAGADAELVAAFVNHLPTETAQHLERGIAELGPTRLADIEGAQAALVEVAGKLAAEGKLRGGQPIHLTAVA